MIVDLFPFSTLLLIAIALTPGLIQWWSGRALVRAIDDPALPERLAARQRQHGPTVGFAVALIVIGWSPSWFWAVPLAIVASLIGGYPLRRALYNETWSLAGYLWFIARAVFGLAGFWIALMCMPELANAGAPADVILAVAVAGVLWLWGVKYNNALRVLLRARPIQNEALVSRFTSIAEAAAVPTPRFEFF